MTSLALPEAGFISHFVSALHHVTLWRWKLNNSLIALIALSLSLVISGCASTPFGLTDDATSTTTLDSDVFIQDNTGAAHRVYEKNFDLRASKTDIWHRIRNGFGMPDIQTQNVIDREKWYTDRQKYFENTSTRSRRYLYYIVEEIEKRNMPMELALLPFLESAYNPEAVSHANAAGMWQFIPSTGLNFKLQQDIFRDERRDVIASTNAALDYLQLLYNMFGDWHLALAAYNWGEGNVLRAINANKRQNRPTDYLSLNMPNETQGYVPALQALKNIIAAPDKYNIKLPAIANHPFFQTVGIEKDMDVELIIKLANISKEEFSALNPAVHKPVILAVITPQILLPWDNADTFITKLRAYKGKLSSWTIWQTPRTMTVAQAAAETKMPEKLLREVNDIPPSMLIRSGSTLLVRHNQSNPSNVKLSHIQNARLELTRSGSGRMATPSKIAVSEESQNQARGRTSSNRQPLSRPAPSQRPSPARSAAGANRASSPSKVSVP